MALLALLQTEPRFGHVVENLDASERRLAGLRADLLVLPELFATGYSFRDRAEAASLAETFPEGPTCRRILAWSRATGGVVVGGYAEKHGERTFNAAAVVAAGRPLLSYRKVHLFGFEKECFDPGDGPFPVVEHAGLRVGVMVCFDWMFPEAARTLALGGADVIAHPSNLVMPWCQSAMRVRSLENGVYAVTANRVGVEERAGRPRLRFTGRSQITDPRGEVVACAPDEGESLVTAVADPALARDKRLPAGNDLFRDRRPEWYRTTL